MKETGRNGFQSKVIEQLESQAAFVINIHGHMMQKAGLPDLQVIHRRWDGFLELKVGPQRLKKNQPSDIQYDIAAKIKARGMPVYVLRCVEVEGFCGGGSKYGIWCQYMLENFEGKVIKRIDDLRSLLDVLVKLNETKERMK